MTKIKSTLKSKSLTKKRKSIPVRNKKDKDFEKILQELEDPKTIGIGS